MSCRLRNCRNRKKKKRKTQTEWCSGKKVFLKMLSIRENALASGAPPQTPLGELMDGSFEGHESATEFSSIAIRLCHATQGQSEEWKC